MDPIDEDYKAIHPHYVELGQIFLEILSDLARQIGASPTVTIWIKDKTAVESAFNQRKNTCANFAAFCLWTDFLTAQIQVDSVDQLKQMNASIVDNFTFIPCGSAESRLSVNDKGHLEVIYTVQLDPTSPKLIGKSINNRLLGLKVDIVVVGAYNYVQQNVQRFIQTQADFDLFAKILNETLGKIAKTITGEYSVQTRAKDVVSFAEKIQRKPRIDPIREITDLVGGRVIFTTLEDMERFRKVLDKNFTCLDNEDTIARLSTDQFGYLSVHYTVQLLNASPFLKGVTIPLPLFDIKVEIQVRTNLQHAWSQFEHDTFYKPNITLPKAIQRRSKRLAAILEEADQEFQVIKNQMLIFETNYGAYMSRRDIDKELNKYLNVYNSMPVNPNDPLDLKRKPIAIRIAKLARYISRWDIAISVLSKYADQDDPYVKREYGIALYQSRSKEPASPEFLKGQKYLEDAIKLNPKDSDAIASLGGTYRRQKNVQKAFECYQRAYETNPEDMYAVSNYFIWKIIYTQKVDFLQESRTVFVQALKICTEQEQNGINVPWVYFNKGLFHLLSGQMNDALQYYLLGVHFSSEIWMTQGTLSTVAQMKGIFTQLPGLVLIRALLLLGLHYRFHDPTALAQLKELYRDSFLQKGLSFANPTLILAGSIKSDMQTRVEHYKESILGAFSKLKTPATIISGGLRSGINGIVGDIQEALGNRVATIGYNPQQIPSGEKLDPRYKQQVRGNTTPFDQENILQYWVDLCLANMDPANIRVLGIGGGSISAFEYHLGLTFGARVGILRDSAGEASKLVQDPTWNQPTQTEGIAQNPNLAYLENSAEEIGRFLQ